MVARVCASNKNGRKFGVIDAGDGKGYLSTTLSIEYDTKVLGIDCNPTNTLGALARTDVLGRFYDGVKANKVKKQRQKSSDKAADSAEVNKQKTAMLLNENYRNATHFITPRTSFAEIFCEHFDLNTDDVPGLCLSGLHTCGDLASTCLQIFTENQRISAVCNIGCCYNKISEKFNQYEYEHNPYEREKKIPFESFKNVEPNDDEIPSHGFPMSRFLIESQTCIGHTARMLACSSVHRTIDKKEQPSRNLFYRALIEILIQRKSPEHLNRVQVGRMKPCSSFAEYARNTNTRNPWLKFDCDHLPDEELLELHDEYRMHELYFDVYQLMRISLAATIETIILLDRLLYLKENEQDGDMSYLLRFFHPVTSPRCYGLVAIKNSRNI